VERARGTAEGRRKGILLGLAVAIGYGAVFRLLLEVPGADQILVVVSLAFVFEVPVIVGYLTVRSHPDPGWLYRLFMPWVAVLASTGILALAAVEGTICIYMALPIMLPLASIGGIAGALVRPRRAAPVAMFAVLPFLAGGIERHIPDPVDVREVESTIDIHAPPERVWREVVNVPEIAPDELPDALYLRMGFPRPLSETIDRAGVGAVRRATFTGGVVFHETVTTWDEPKVLSFRIAAQTDSIPATTLDRHVTIGGPYFDVLQGTYEIEPLPGGDSRLHLTSRLRVATHFNAYSGPWVDTIMRSIQETILVVQRERAQR
jgi:uncharacterized protein YndB with AHSA1/START domain